MELAAEERDVRNGADAVEETREEDEQLGRREVSRLEDRIGSLICRVESENSWELESRFERF